MPIKRSYGKFNLVQIIASVGSSSKGRTSAESSAKKIGKYSKQMVIKM